MQEAGIVRRWVGWIAAAAAFAAIGCSTSSEPDVGDASTLDGDSPIFNDGKDFLASDAADTDKVYTILPLCSGIEGCHLSGAGGLSFPTDEPARNLVGVASSEHPELLRVRPYDPEGSYLYLKLRGAVGIDGQRMPPGPGFDPRIAEAFRRWIDAGAPTFRPLPSARNIAPTRAAPW